MLIILIFDDDTYQMYSLDKLDNIGYYIGRKIEKEGLYAKMGFIVSEQISIEPYIDKYYEKQKEHDDIETKENELKELDRLKLKYEKT